MTKEEAIKKIEITIDKSFELFQKESEWQSIISVRNQLYYVLEALKKENDRSKLSEINIGIYAFREFEAYSEGFANMLHEVSGINRLMMRGKF
jgi:hypothetical protein